jgi:hypothetical protein
MTLNSLVPNTAPLQLLGQLDIRLTSTTLKPLAFIKIPAAEKSDLYEVNWCFK